MNDVNRLNWCNISRNQLPGILLLTAMIWLFSSCHALQINPLGERLRPSNDRRWSPELAVLPFAEFPASTDCTTAITIRNIRNCQYASATDYVVEHYDKTFQLADVQSVDFIVVPFNETAALAHTMLSFGFADGAYLGVSVEVRREVGEEYSPMAGMLRQFEISFVLADERDLIRVRTRHRDASVYVYPSVATPDQAQQLLVNVLQRVNQLAAKPEFYNSITNNCTTNLTNHVNALRHEPIPLSWQVLLPGFSAKYAYDLGLLPNAISFEDLTALALVNDLAETHFDDLNFSQRIRSKRRLIDRAIAGSSQTPDPITAGE